MTLLLDPTRLEARRRALGDAGAGADGLAPLADALARELAPLVERGPWFPPEKARLTRQGGRCARDGTLLEFDPWSPRLHRCARCGATYDGDEHYRWWIYGYQLWLAERAVHAAVLHALRGDERHGRLADAILDGYAERYLSYPNADNVLGPTRVFFSTYLESIWLLQLCVAADLRRSAGGGASVDRFIGAVVAPSVEIVGAYDEGMSNRQTWNAAALLAAARLTGDDAAAERHAMRDGGVAGHLRRGLLADGSWYEGENYHLFAHRALWYGVTLAERAGIALPARDLARFDAGYVVPFITALPDFTFPARRDSQYAVSLRQWRFAELAELGLARTGDARLRTALDTLYADAPAGDTGRSRSTGEAERNAPAARLTRADLGWKSLLAALDVLPDARYVAPAGSVLMEGQGLAILRRDAGRVYVSLDYGHSGGGHGHPDRLNLTLHDGATRWLDDVGTGSYTDPTLHWYRSTLAHNAPLLDGHSQARADGRLVAWEERGGAGWVEAEYLETVAATLLVRTVVVMPDYLIDTLAWRGAADVVDLPVHADGVLHHVEAWCAREVAGGVAPTDGFAFVTEGEVTYPAEEAPVRLDAELGDARASAWFLPAGPAEYWRLVAPGPPYQPPRPMHMVRMAGDAERGLLTTVWSWRGVVRDAAADGDDVVVMLPDGARHAHRRTAEGWHIDLQAGGATSSIDLGGVRGRRTPADVEPLVSLKPAAPPLTVVESRLMSDAFLPRLPQLDAPLDPAPGALVDDVALAAWRASLGERDWRRTEQDWQEAGAPSADVAIVLTPDELVVEVRVRAVQPWFARAATHNPLDNEHPDVNSSGLQLYFGQHAVVDPALPPPAPDAAFLLVPEESPFVRATPLGADEEMLPDLDARWVPAEDGWVVRVAVARDWVADSNVLGVHIVVNEMPRGRERRRGQLVLGGAVGEWGYLRGDREDPARLLYFDTSDA